MPEDLKKLSDRATPGEAYADMGDYRLIAHPPGSTYVPDRTVVALCACGGKAGANVHFLAALWTTYRRGELHDDTALATAVARARREALEEAARRVLEIEHESGELGIQNAQYVSDEILALRAATPPEARQTETEADNLRIAMRMFMDSGHGGAMATVRQWFAAGGIGPVPDPEGACFWAWAKDNGLSKVGGFVRASPSPAIVNLDREGRS